MSRTGHLVVKPTNRLRLLGLVLLVKERSVSMYTADAAAAAASVIQQAPALQASFNRAPTDAVPLASETG